MSQFFPNVLIFPVSSYQLSLFITHMFESGLAPSSIVTYTAGITTCHKLVNLTDPGNSFLVKKLLTAALKTKTTKDCRLPINKQILSTMLGHLSQVIIKLYDNIMYRAMFLLAFYAFLRIGEITISQRAPLFTKQNKLAITRAQFSQTLRQVIKKAGFDDSRIKGHSFRIKAATTAASLGFTEDQIQRMGRWRSDAVKKYIRITSFTIK